MMGLELFIGSYYVIRLEKIWIFKQVKLKQIFRLNGYIDSCNIRVGGLNDFIFRKVILKYFIVIEYYVYNYF